jgi:hypothetical protein
VFAARTTGGCTRSTATTGPTYCAWRSVVSLAEGSEKRDGSRSIVTAAVSAGGQRIGLTHWAKFLKACATGSTLVFIQRHGKGSPLEIEVRFRQTLCHLEMEGVVFGPQTDLLYNGFGIRSSDEHQV